MPRGCYSGWTCSFHAIFVQVHLSPTSTRLSMAAVYEKSQPTNNPQNTSTIIPQLQSVSPVIMNSESDSASQPVVEGTLTVDDIIIAVMGPTGSGKSTFIEVATGCSPDIGHGLVSCTNKITVYKTVFPHSESSIYLVDTPGFDYDEQSDAEIFELLATWLNDTYKRKIRLSGLLYFHRISDNRMSGSALRSLCMFEQLSGSHFKNIILATTMWDEVDEATGHRREEELKKFYWKAMIDRGSTTQRFDRSREAAFKILTPIVMDSNKPYVLLLQKEVGEEGIALQRTTAGFTLELGYRGLIKKQRELQRKIRDELKQPPEDEEHFQRLMNECRSISIALGQSRKVVNRPAKYWWTRLRQRIVNGSFLSDSQVHRSPDLLPSPPSRRSSAVKIGDVTDGREVSFDDLAADDIVVLLLGITGTGKSTFIWHSSGYNPGVGHELCSSTREVKMVKVSCEEPAGTSVVLVDTPGFDNSAPETMSDKVISSMLSEWYRKLRTTGIPVAGVIILHKINEAMPREPLRLIDKHCEETQTHLDNIVIGTTMWEYYRNEEAKGLDMEMKLKGTKPGVAYERVDNKEDALSVLRKVLVGGVTA